MGFEAVVQHFFTTYAHKPLYVYAGVYIFMYASAFGLPLPEEIVLISSGFMAFVATHPAAGDVPQGSGVDPIVLSILALVAVVTSDAIIFYLGHKFGKRLLRSELGRRYISSERQARIQSWSTKYGYWASGIFRFTPGLRFPGHLFCGLSGMPFSKFLAVDGTAALLTIPPQILLIAYYGDAILKYVREFKIALPVIMLLIFGSILARRSWKSARTKQDGGGAVLNS